MDAQSSSCPAFKKERWTKAEDDILRDYVRKHGGKKWNAIAKATGLARCGKSCRHRWINHLKSSLTKAPITIEEEQLITQLHAEMGNKWACIVKHLPGRTDNEIKNFWNCKKKKRFKSQGVGGVALPSPPLVLDPSNVPQQQQQEYEYECSPPIVPAHGVPGPSVTDIVAQYLHCGAIAEATELTVAGMLHSRGITIPNYLRRVPAPSPSPMMAIDNVDPQAPSTPLPTMSMVNVGPLAHPQFPISGVYRPASWPSEMMTIANVDQQAPLAVMPTMPMANVAPWQLPIAGVDHPATCPSEMMTIANVDQQAPLAAMPTMPMANVDPQVPRQLPIAGVDHPATWPSEMMATVNVDPQAPSPQWPIASVDHPATWASEMMATVNVDPQAPLAEMPTTMPMANVDLLASPQWAIAGVDHSTSPLVGADISLVNVDTRLDFDFDFDIDLDKTEAALISCLGDRLGVSPSTNIYRS